MRRTRRVSFALAPLLAVTLAWYGCSGGRQTGAATSGAAVAVVDGYMAAWNAHDAAQAASFLADSVSYLDASVGTPQVGRDNAKTNVIQAFITAVPDCRWVRDGDAVVSPSGDAVAFQWTFSGTNTGAWADGTKGKGKPFSITGLTLIHLRNGKIQSQFDAYDALGFYKQIGLM